MARYLPMKINPLLKDRKLNVYDVIKPNFIIARDYLFGKA